ncbi:hypothetical protein F5Y14DRAFT_77683 [Nemania sp. NC0429]|nr:hypothetical protein F5Y14DRAFT_77683 [Nemania sp. NC0429]
MEEGRHFQSIAEAATASWLAHRASTPSSKHPSSTPIIPNSSQRQTSMQALVPGSTSTPASIPASIPASVAAASASPSGSVSASASESKSESESDSVSESPAPSSVHPPLAEVPAPMASAQPSARSASTSSRTDGEFQASRNIHSDITAWQSALQSLPPGFPTVPLPSHPLAQALADQPTLRPVEWNAYRQQGSFVPRTPHDYSSLMIFISGVVNPNPCRNCLLRNGPFARCVVAPPAVLAVSTLRHACANCTYQMQYKRCTNDPLTEQEKARSELLRSIARSKSAAPRPVAIVKRPAITGTVRRKHERKSLKLQRQPQEQRLEARGNVSATQSSAGMSLALGANFESFDEKLKHVRARSPRSRRRMAAEALQWQAALATVEAEEPAPPPTNGNPLYTSLTNNYTIPQPAPPAASSSVVRDSSVRFAAPIYPPIFPPSRAGAEHTSYGAEQAYDPMDEDEGEDEQVGEYEGSPWIGPGHTVSKVKPPR